MWTSKYCRWRISNRGIWRNLKKGHWTFTAFVLIGTILFILLDELVMGCGQRRIGPLNLGRYGIPPSIINGRNPIIAQSPFPKVNIHIHFGYQSFPVMFLPSSLRNYIIPSPFSLVDIYLPIILSIILTGLALVFIIFTPISARSKHSVPGSIRIIPQLIPLELIFTTILLLTIRSWNDPPMGICAAA